MKNRIKNYVFTPGAAGVGTLQFTDVQGLSKDGILLIQNQTTGIAYYNLMDPVLSAGTVSGNTLTFGVATNTNGALSSDKLTIFYEDGLTVSDVMITGLSGQTALGNNLLSSTGSAAGTDVLGFRSASIQINPTGTSGTYIFEQSNDNVTWAVMAVSAATQLADQSTTTSITLTATPQIYALALITRYIRVRVSAALGVGGAQAVAKLSTAPFAPNAVRVVSGTSGVSVSGTVTSNQGVANAVAWPAIPLHPTPTTTGDSGAKTTSPYLGNQILNSNSKGLLCVINMGVVTVGTGGTATFKLQGSADNGTTWLDIPGATTAAIVASGAYGIMVYPGSSPVSAVATSGTMAVSNVALPRTWRVLGTFAGSGYSFTITNVQFSHLI